MDSPTYEVKLVTAANQSELVSSHATRDEAIAALPVGALRDDDHDVWVDADGVLYLIEMVVR